MTADDLLDENYKRFQEFQKRNPDWREAPMHQELVQMGLELMEAFANLPDESL